MFESTDSLTLFLLCGIALFLAVALWLLAWTFLKRKKRLRRKREYRKLEEELNELLFRYAMSEASVDSFFREPFYLAHKDRYIFRLLLLRQLMHLDSQFSGQVKANISEIFKGSTAYTFMKEELKKNKWVSKMNGMRAISRFNCLDMDGELENNLFDEHPMLRIQALVSLVQLKGYTALYFLKDYPYDLCYWQIERIVHYVQEAKNSQLADYVFLTEDSNRDVRVLGYRLIGENQQVQYLEGLKAELQDSNYTRDQLRILDRTLQQMIKNMPDGTLG